MDFYTILAFISGGGVSGLITGIFTIRYARKTPKLDYTERLGKFWEEQNEKLLLRFKVVEEKSEKFEERIIELEKISCYKTDCQMRITG